MEPETPQPHPPIRVKEILSTHHKVSPIILGLILLIIIGGIFSWAALLMQKAPDSGVYACTMEAKICPDGSAVGRSGPMCEFAQCPGEVDTSSWKTYANKEFEIKLPPGWFGPDLEFSSGGDGNLVWEFQSSDFADNDNGLGLPPPGNIWVGLAQGICNNPSSDFIDESLKHSLNISKKVICQNDFQITLGLHNTDPNFEMHKAELNQILSTFKFTQRAAALPGVEGEYNVLHGEGDSFITIMNGRNIIKKIELKDIPAFDRDDAGNLANPENSYKFGFNTYLDHAGTKVYFSVYNFVTAGNANADRALFQYDILTGKLSLLVKENFSTSFGMITSSSDDSYLVFSDGYHGGMCNNSLGLVIYDVKNKKEVGKIFLSETKTAGSIQFDHWLNNSQFVYKETTFLNADECGLSYEEGGNVVLKTYTIAK